MHDPPPPATPIDALLARVHDRLCAGAADADAAAAVAALGFAAKLPGAAQLAAPPPTTPLPVRRHLDACFGEAGKDPILDALQPLCPWLHFVQNPNYQAAPPSPEFLEGYGYAKLLVEESVGLSMGVLLLAPRLSYPAHYHAAEELYVTLCPASHWQRGTEPWCQLPLGALIHHPPNLPHAMKADATPLLALYLWIGESGHARLSS